jgi:hypothetical protein
VLKQATSEPRRGCRGQEMALGLSIFNSDTLEEERWGLGRLGLLGLIWNCFLMPTEPKAGNIVVGDDGGW